MAKREFIAARDAAIEARRVAVERVASACGQQMDYRPAGGPKITTMNPSNYCAYERGPSLTGKWAAEYLTPESHWFATLRQVLDEAEWLKNNLGLPEQWEAEWAKRQL